MEKIYMYYAIDYADIAVINLSSHHLDSCQQNMILLRASNLSQFF